MTRVPAKQSADWRTPLALLAGEMKVSRVCARVELAERERATGEGNVVLRCQVRGASADGADPHNDRQDADLPADSERAARTIPYSSKSCADTGELARLLVRQSGGVQVEFRFENWRMNPPVPDSLFRFDVPLGVAIVNGELPAGDARVK